MIFQTVLRIEESTSARLSMERNVLFIYQPRPASKLDGGRPISKSNLPGGFAPSHMFVRQQAQAQLVKCARQAIVTACLAGIVCSQGHQVIILGRTCLRSSKAWHEHCLFVMLQIL